MASRLILVSVLPVLTASPIWNCHFQTLGTAVTATVYCTPLCIMRNLRHDSLRPILGRTSSCICSILLSMCETAARIQKWTARANERPAYARKAVSSVPSAEHYVVLLRLVGSRIIGLLTTASPLTNSNCTTKGRSTRYSQAKE